MSAAEGQEQEVKFSLKIVMNKEKSKVLFAEVGSDFADVLLSFLALPLGTVAGLLIKHYEHDQAAAAAVIGSLNTLYKGLENLDGSNFWTAVAKQMLVNPRNLLQPQLEKLKLNLDGTEPTRYFICDENCSRSYGEANVSMYEGAISCSRCGKSLNREIKLSVPKNQTPSGDGSGVFTQGRASFLITDDLHIKPNAAGAVLEILTSLGIRDEVAFVEKNIVFGFKEIMDLLKGSLVSRTPLTDIILKNVSNAVKSDQPSSLPKTQKEATSSCYHGKMAVKAIIQKSTNKLLLAQAEEDFVDFLFGLLWIPLGRVLSLLGTNTCLGSINNLYSSLANLEIGKCLKSNYLKSVLLKPQLPPIYLSKYRFFSLSEQGTSPLYFCTRVYSDNDVLTYSSGQSNNYEKYSPVYFMDLDRKDSYVRGPQIFSISDDLTVTPSSAISILSILAKSKILLEDIEEIMFDIGMEEALNILKASLTSTSALTNALILPISLKRQPKQETN